MPKPIRLLLISGSTRALSTNTAALRTLQALAPVAVTARLYDGLADLPAFNPDVDDENAPATVVDLRRQLQDADAVLFCTPEYAGTLPGSLKNLIDWTVGTGELYRKPVAWLNVANPGRGEGAVATLAVVLGYVDATLIESACVRLPLSSGRVGDDGLVNDPLVREGLIRTCEQIVAFVQSRV